MSAFPCDGGCSPEGGPEETCSLHGRPPAELWDMIRRMNEQRSAVRRAMKQSWANRSASTMYAAVDKALSPEPQWLGSRVVDFETLPPDPDGGPPF